MSERERRAMSADDRLRRIAEIIERVESRCAAADGPVTRTLEMLDTEMRLIYRLAKGKR